MRLQVRRRKAVDEGCGQFRVVLHSDLDQRSQARKEVNLAGSLLFQKDMVSRFKPTLKQITQHGLFVL
jgi:predicted nicotinamide N-methyase